MPKMIKLYKGDLVEYEVYKLVDYYDPILRQPTVPFKFESVEDNKRAHYIAFSMAETLGTLEGLGLSANQVGMNERFCAINMGHEVWTMFNPQIISHSLVPSKYQEGCLSYPGLYLKVPRWDAITVRFQAINGEFVEKEFTGLTAVCIQHELDHLDGVLFTNKVSQINLERAKRKVKKNLKQMKSLAAVKAAVKAAQETVEAPQPPSPKITLIENSSEQESAPKDLFIYSPT